MSLESPPATGEYTPRSTAHPPTTALMHGVALGAAACGHAILPYAADWKVRGEGFRRTHRHPKPYKA